MFKFIANWKKLRRQKLQSKGFLYASDMYFEHNYTLEGLQLLVDKSKDFDSYDDFDKGIEAFITSTHLTS